VAGHRRPAEAQAGPGRRPFGEGPREGVAAVLISSLSANLARRLVGYFPHAQVLVVALVACVTMRQRDRRAKETNRDT